MDIKEFIEKFAEVLDDMDPAVLSPETQFESLDEWSSLAALGIIAMVDEEYEVELSANELRQAKSIMDVYETILKKL